MSCGACVDTCPTGALTRPTVVEDGDTDALDPQHVLVLRRRVRAAWSGHATNGSSPLVPALDAPVNRGHACVKGRYTHGFVHASDRVAVPMVREGGGAGVLGRKR